MTSRPGSLAFPHTLFLILGFTPVLSGCCSSPSNGALEVIEALERLDHFLETVSASLDEVAPKLVTDVDLKSSLAQLHQNRQLAIEAATWSVEETALYGYVASEWLRLTEPAIYSQLSKESLCRLHVRRFASAFRPEEWIVYKGKDQEFSLGSAGTRLVAFGEPAIRRLVSSFHDDSPMASLEEPSWDFSIRRRDLAGALVLKILGRPTAPMSVDLQGRNTLLETLWKELDAKWRK